MSANNNAEVAQNAKRLALELSDFVGPTSPTAISLQAAAALTGPEGVVELQLATCRKLREVSVTYCTFLTIFDNWLM